jgi:uncharacterized protein
VLVLAEVQIAAQTAEIAVFVVMPALVIVETLWNVIVIVPVIGIAIVITIIVPHNALVLVIVAMIVAMMMTVAMTIIVIAFVEITITTLLKLVEDYYKKNGVHFYFDCLDKVLLNKKLSSDRDGKYTYNKFDLWIFTSLRCNCGCEYCKQNHLRSTAVMTEDTLKYILDECIKIHNKNIVKQFKINLSGGEPFLVFDMFKDVIPYYKNKYPEIFYFVSVTNGTIITDEIINWIKVNLDNSICVSIDDVKFSKPINGISSSDIQIDNILKLNKEGVCVSSISVFDKQESMMPMAEFAINNFCHWRILLVKPYSHTRDEILNIAKPILKYVFKHNKHKIWFDFDGWNLWSKKRIAGCVCGRSFLGILPNTDVMPNNGEIPVKLGKFNSDLMSLINHPLNTLFKENSRPEMCDNCELCGECDYGCKACHSFPEKMKERCDALKELFQYVQTLKE